MQNPRVFTTSFLEATVAPATAPRQIPRQGQVLGRLVGLRRRGLRGRSRPRAAVLGEIPRIAVLVPGLRDRLQRLLLLLGRLALAAFPP